MLPVAPPPSRQGLVGADLHRLQPADCPCSRRPTGPVVPFIAQFVVGRDGISEAEANAWEAEQRELAQRSEFFFACIQFCFTATRPG